MANDGQIVFEVTADGTHAIADIKDITRAIQNETKNWDKAAEQSTDSISNSFSGMLKKLVAGFSAVKIGKALLDIGKDALEAASALEEVQNVVDVTFGENANQIEKWAKNAGTQFGLTETQAKKFTSTMGAMLKSSGMAGQEIVDVSTDLAGLAADMASFYNLDFEEAFAKIRSGISGQTMPLKELGIDMSVATLNAFALQQGLTKTFNEMDQGEQTMLRYQYLMQATADAQGDFSRTSDGYANSVRRAETAIESLKTQLGQLLIGPAADALTWLNDFLGKLTTPPTTTVLDDFNKIDIDTEGKLEQIRTVAEEANTLTEVLKDIGGKDAGEAIQRMAEGANKLDASSPSTWRSVASALTKVDGLANIFTNDASGNIEDLANALTNSELDEGKADAWKKFLGALSENADAVSKLTGTGVDETKAWLDGLAESVNKINPEDAAAWDTLLTTLATGLSGDTPEGKQFLESLSTNLLALGSDSEASVKGLQALGFSSDEIAEKQSAWLETCKRLVNTIPGLNKIINTETGEVEGGVDAIRDYVKAWEEGQTKLAMMGALEQKKSALSSRFADLPGFQLDMALAQRKVKQQAEKIRQLYKQYGIREDLMPIGSKFKTTEGYYKNLPIEYMRELNGAVMVLEDLQAAEAEATQKYQEQADALKEAQIALEEYQETVDEMPGSIDKVVNAEEDWLKNTGKTEEEIKALVNTAQEQLKALADYAQGVRDSVAASVDSVVKGFETITRPTTSLEKQRDELIKQQNELDKGAKDYDSKYADIQKRINEINKQIEQYSPKGMKESLESQMAFMDEYTKNLKKAQSYGLSNEFLASLSDGSVESAEYLMQIVDAWEHGNGAGVKEVDAMYQEVQKKKQELTDALTQQQLTVDQVYKSMAEEARKAVEALDLGAEAKSNSGKTVAEMAQGISDHVSDVKEAVDGIISELNRLNGWGINIDLGTFGNINFGVSATQVHSHEMGADYIPFDGYLATLHEGEAVLTAEENRIWQRFKNGANGGIDYDAMGGVMRDNIKPGGNVYLDGRIVGNVISEQQGRSYRQLQRSGWQG